MEPVTINSKSELMLPLVVRASMLALIPAGSSTVMDPLVVLYEAPSAGTFDIRSLMSPFVVPATTAPSFDSAVTLPFVVWARTSPVTLATTRLPLVVFALTWTPDESQFAGVGVHVPPPPDDPNAPPGLFTAIQEQPGLRLESTKVPVEVLVIDRAERPSEN